MSTIASNISREAGRVAAGVPHHIEAVRAGNMRPAHTVARKALAEAQTAREAAAHDREHFIVKRFLEAVDDAQRAELEDEIARLEQEIAEHDREIERHELILRHLQSHL